MVYSAGTRLGDFCIERRIGRGGMASVYSAMQCSVERRVALKIIEFQPESSRDFLKRFTREAEVIARLEHIHILPIYAYGIVEGELAYLAMRLIEHGTLADLIAKRVLPLEEALDLFAQLASGLEHMHNQGVIHRDLKPSNILLDENRYVYLSDFGLARSSEMSMQISDDALHLAGSPHYLAPELLQGEPATNLSDIYSLGIILYQMLTGHLPFEAENGRVSALMYKHLREAPLPPRQFNPEISPEVEAVVLRTLSKNPRERYASASEVVYALHEALERAPAHSPLRQFSRSSARSLPSLQRSARHLVTRRRLRYAATALILCLLLVGMTVAWDRLRVLPKPMNILSGESGTFATMSVSGDEVADAQARLEPDGFIAHFPCTMSSAYQVTLSRELADMATGYGLPLRVYESHDDPTAQAALIDRARFDGAKIIILCPLSQTLLTHAIAALENAAIPLVLTAPYNTPYGVKVEIDNYLVGEQQGAYAADLLRRTHDGRGNIILLIATETATGAQRAQGTHDALIADAPDAAITATLAGYTRQQGYESTRDYLATGQPLVGIVTQTDAGALGAIDALQEAGISPDDVFIVSSNNESAIRGYIAEGYYVRGSMDTNRAEHSQLIMDSVIKLLAGSPVPEHVIRSGGSMVTAETLLQDQLTSH